MIRRMHTAPAAKVATGFGVSIRTARKWMSRYRQGGVEALADKSSRPRRCRNTLTEENVYRMLALRKMCMTGDEIALRLGFCRSSVFRALRKLAPGLPPWRRNCLLCAINGKCQDKCYIWLSSGLERLMGLGTEKHVHGKSIVADQAGNICRCALMAHPALHIRQYSRMKPQNQQWNSYALPLRGMPHMGLK